MKVQLQSELFYPSVGGIENYLYYASKTLLELGHEPDILCAKHLPHLPKKEIYNNINIIRHPYYRLPKIPFAPLNPLFYVNKLQQFIKSNSSDYDMIWARLFYEAYSSAKALKGDVPIIFILAALVEPVNKIVIENSHPFTKFYVKNIIYPQYTYIEKKAIEMSDKIVVLSTSKMQEVSDYYGVSKDLFKVIPPGVDLDVFKPSVKDEELLRLLKLEKNSKVILTVSRLSHEKNIELLIKSFSKINNNNTFLVIVGDGIEKNRLEHLAIQLGVFEKVRFVGTRNDVSRFYSIADLFVLCSTYEGFGQVFLEAMSSGVPCIGMKPDYPNVIVASDEIIIPGKTGYLVDPYSETDLTDKIEKILFDDQKLDNFGLFSRKTCEKNYSWEKCVNSLLNLNKKL